MVAAHSSDGAEKRANRGVYQSAEVWNEAFHSLCAGRLMTDGLEILAGKWYQRVRAAGWFLLTSLLLSPVVPSLQRRGAVGCWPLL